MERVADEIDGVELGVADFDAFLVGAGIKSAFDRQAGFRRRRADQFDDREAIGQRTTAPFPRRFFFNLFNGVPTRLAGGKLELFQLCVYFLPLFLASSAALTAARSTGAQVLRRKADLSNSLAILAAI